MPRLSRTAPAATEGHERHPQVRTHLTGIIDMKPISRPVVASQGTLSRLDPLPLAATGHGVLG